ncbi:hypothetical protein PIB30_085884 [Stylosanthes scabra]|uniref:Uncharacterized protein n=1 Tax=Stylosanthes scabra TaxID=79078 RepID=A0ABU6VWL4_9FABA|nr:hypothetical protein [Stylosanthes scabra]
MPTCCYYYGRIGHENTYETATKDEEASLNKSKGLGPWVKAEQTGKRVELTQQQFKGKEATDEEQEKRRKEKLIERLMEKFANLSMSDHKRLDAGKGKEQKHQWQQRRRLLSSLAEPNEDLELELPWAWEPMDNESFEQAHKAEVSQSCFLNGNKEEGE